MPLLALVLALSAPFAHAMPYVTPTAPPPALIRAPAVCAKGPVAFGTDVSAHNPDPDWAAVRAGGLSFAFIKATEGITSVNPRFAADWAAAKRRGLVTGAYHFFRPQDDPTRAARAFLAVVHGVLAATDLPVVFDWESADGVGAALQIKRALVWLNLVEAATGKAPIIYVSPAYWTALGNPAVFGRYPLFVADYGVACPRVPAPWTTWAFWQSGVGAVPGLSGDGDQDLFNGAAAALKTFRR